MTRLTQAGERFDTALGSLVEAVEPLAKTRKAADDAQARLAALNEERERLLARIAALEEESRALAGVTEEVETRLDGAIEEIRSALGR
jgi:uncharacterized protein (DUF3084 family)